MYGVNPYMANPYASQTGYQTNPYMRANPGIQFVNDEQSAKAYPLMPNSQVILMDKNTSRFYWAEADAAGVKSLKTYEFYEVKEGLEKDKYVTVEEFERWKQNYESTIRANKSDGDVIEVTPVYEDNFSKRSQNQTSEHGRYRTH